MVCSSSRSIPLLTLSSVSALLLTSALAPPAASAAGFTGDFDPANWNLYSYLGVTFPPNAATGTPDESSSFSGYLCTGASTNCINNLDQVAGTAVVRGSDANATPPHGSINQQWATQWETTYGGAGPVSVSFNWAFVSSDLPNSDISYWYTIDPSNSLSTFVLGSTSGNTGSASVRLDPGWTIGFGVYTKDNTGSPGNLAIGNFTAASVPGPLPVLGASAAFAWSRRLRARVRRRSACV